MRDTAANAMKVLREHVGNETDLTGAEATPLDEPFAWLVKLPVESVPGVCENYRAHVYLPSHRLAGAAHGDVEFFWDDPSKE